MEYKQIGVIPYIKRNNTYRFVIITSRSHPGRWILPKGQSEADRTDREVAALEAFEEAGLIGSIKGKAIKIPVQKGKDTVVYKLYPFKVTSIRKRWPERKYRKRRFLKSDRALRKLKFQPWGKAVDNFLAQRG